MWGAVGGGKREKARKRESEKVGERERGAGEARVRVRWSYAEVHEKGSRFSDVPILVRLGAVL